jgi:hypothetical protein
MFKKWIIFLLLCGLAMPVFAQEMGSLNYGQTVGGTLTGYGGHRWTFFGNAGDVITISMVSESFDTYLELHDASLTMLTSNDDGGGYTNSLISNYRLPTTGQYGIVARSFGTDSRGSYGLTLELSGSGSRQPITPPRTNTTGMIGYGETINGTFYNETCQDWTFYGASNDTVQISLQSSNFDTYLYLYDAYGNLIEENDDGGNGTNSQIIRMLTSGNTYTIGVCAYGGSTTTGAYTLSLLYAGASGGQQTPLETRTGYLTPNTYDTWTFDAMTGETVTIAMSSNDFDTYLELYAPNGTLFAMDDDSGGNLNALIQSVVLPDTGTYIIRLKAFSGGSGSYTATMSFTGGFVGETMPLTSNDYMISYGQRMTSNLAGFGGHRWAFYGTAGDVVIINVYSNDFDTVVELHDPSLMMLAQDDDGGDGTNSFLTYTLPRSGEYGIVVHGYSEGASGNYTVELKAR